MTDDLNEQDSEELFEHFRIVADPGQTGIRLDKFLFDRLPNASRNKIQQGIKLGYTTINEERVKPNYKVRPGDVVSVSLLKPPRDEDVIPEDIPLDIIYEDEYLLVVNKHPGMVVHPAYQNWTGTLVNALVYHFTQLPEMKGNAGRPGLVHRIDKDTSGLLVIAKNEEAMEGLARQFYDHSIKRTYQALVWGVPEPDEGTVNVNLARSMKDRRVTEAIPEGDRGKRAVTHYKVLRDMRYVSLVECRLETGRTHQIRAHMKYLGHPLFNDIMYGGDRILKGTTFSKYKAFVNNCFKILPRQALHAKTLGFVHPGTGEFVEFSSDLPEDLAGAIAKWGAYIDNIN